MTDLELGAAAAADIIRHIARVDITKALDPLDPADFDTIVARLQRAMTRATAGTEAKILNAAVNALDVDWANLSPAARARVMQAAASTIARIPARTIPALTSTMRVTGERVQRTTRRAVRTTVSATFRSRIGISLSAQDRRVTEHAAESQAHYITDHWGRRRHEWSATARGIVAQGLEDGLGRDEIAAMLHARLGPEAGARTSRAYYDVVASNYAARARSFAHLRSFEDAGIERYVFEAVMDERTTDQCACLHGRVFETAAAVGLYDAVARSEDPEAVRDIQPWLRVGRGPEGERILFTERRDGSRTHVATVLESRVGQRDAPGSFANVRSNRDLQEMGLCMPPLHARCRSTIVADV